MVRFTYKCIRFSEPGLYSHDLDLSKHRALTVRLSPSRKSTWVSCFRVALRTHLAGISHRSWHTGCYHPLHPLAMRSTLAQRPFHTRTYFPRGDRSHLNSFFPWAGATGRPFLGVCIPPSAHFSEACCPFSRCCPQQKPLICEVRDTAPREKPSGCHQFLPVAALDGAEVGASGFWTLLLAQLLDVTISLFGSGFISQLLFCLDI